MGKMTVVYYRGIHWSNPIDLLIWPDGFTNMTRRVYEQFTFDAWAPAVALETEPFRADGIVV